MHVTVDNKWFQTAVVLSSLPSFSHGHRWRRSGDGAVGGTHVTGRSCRRARVTFQSVREPPESRDGRSGRRHDARVGAASWCSTRFCPHEGAVVPSEFSHANVRHSRGCCSHLFLETSSNPHLLLSSSHGAPSSSFPPHAEFQLHKRGALQ